MIGGDSADDVYVKQSICIKLSPSGTASSGNGKLTATTCTEHVTKVAETGFHTKLSAIDFNLSGWSTINWASYTTTSWAHIVWVWRDFTFDTTAFFVYPELAPAALDRVHTNSSATHCTWVRTRVTKKV